MAKDIFHQSIKQKIWTNSFVFSLIVFVLFILATALLEKPFSLLTINRAMAGTSAIMFAAAFSLSGFCYYWDFLDTKIAYRKYLGLLGFWYALAYSISLLIVDPERYLIGFTKNFFTADILLGLMSMTIFGFIAIISNDKIMLKMGPHRWRKTLRLGYLAWVLLALRAYLIEKNLWLEYFQSLEGFPPPRLLLSLLVVAVIIFRLSITFSKCFKFKKINK
ncbi:hypothetical protein HOB10_00995 [Candidatus Parcubacteria bacterium]|jgi:DMSO/TMAO reductase YedYZ heme-binding membrane subunit|nr:hypothetical protein [Candidatus Parcubacteria bacterium]